MLNAIHACLPDHFPWKDRIHHFPSVVSTNTLAKAMAAEGAPHGTVLIADSQTGGRGRMGRSFHSPSGSGIYLSLILRPNCHAMQLMHLTCAVGVAVCDAIENTCGLRPGIKWINDLVCQNRKLGGILTELSISSDGTVTYAVVGIGINCSQKEQDFPEDIRKIATSLSLATGIDFPRNQVVAAMLESLERMSRSLLKEQDRIMDMYRKDCITIGQEVTVVGSNPIRRGIATGVDHAGSLLITFSDGHKEALNSGEVSVRGIYGYI